MTNQPCIGIVGGMGPFADLDLERKIFEHTQAITNQDHINVLHIPKSSDVSDLTVFLLRKTEKNPADFISVIIQKITGLGVVSIGIPHGPLIFNSVVENLKKVNV